MRQRSAKRGVHHDKMDGLTLQCIRRGVIIDNQVIEAEIVSALKDSCHGSVEGEEQRRLSWSDSHDLIVPRLVLTRWQLVRFVERLTLTCHKHSPNSSIIPVYELARSEVKRVFSPWPSTDGYRVGRRPTPGPNQNRGVTGGLQRI